MTFKPGDLIQYLPKFQHVDQDLGIVVSIRQTLVPAPRLGILWFKAGIRCWEFAQDLEKVEK